MAGVTTFTQSIADEICEGIADGLSLRTICLRDNMPSRATVFKWLNDVEGFSDQYARAREEQAETLADEIVSIADDKSFDTNVNEQGYESANTEWISRSKLRVDARKWVASKLKPKKYGDKIQQELSGDLNIGFHEALVKARERAGT